MNASVPLDNKVNGIPRRARVDLLTPAERAIREAIIAVEEVGADPLLTEALVLLGHARERLADYVDRENVSKLQLVYEALSEILPPDARGWHTFKVRMRRDETGMPIFFEPLLSSDEPKAAGT